MDFSFDGFWHSSELFPEKFKIPKFLSLPPPSRRKSFDPPQTTAASFEVEDYDDDDYDYDYDEEEEDESISGLMAGAARHREEMEADRRGSSASSYFRKFAGSPSANFRRPQPDSEESQVRRMHSRWNSPRSVI